MIRFWAAAGFLAAPQTSPGGAWGQKSHFATTPAHCNARAHGRICSNGQNAQFSKSRVAQTLLFRRIEITPMIYRLFHDKDQVALQLVKKNSL